MFVELAIGDAYGVGYEFVVRSAWSRPNNLGAYAKHPRHFLDNPAGRGVYSDDTCMSIALAELFLENVEWTPINIASKFVTNFWRDYRKGAYSPSFQEFLENTKTGQDFLDNIRPDSIKSGAAMRATPCGLFTVKSEVLEKAEIQAKLTHNTLQGIESAQAAALMVWALCEGCYPEDLRGYLVEEFGSYWENKWHGRVGNLGLPAVNAALTSLEKYSSMSQILMDCIDWTGDVDTVATIALAAASMSSEIKNDLPKVLYDNLENGKYGLDYLRSLDVEINKRVKVRVAGTDFEFR